MDKRDKDGNQIDGIPAVEGFTQIEAPAELNRDEAESAFRETERNIDESEVGMDVAADELDSGTGEESGTAYALGNKDNQEWSVGLEDEQNNSGYPSFADLDADLTEDEEQQPDHPPAPDTQSFEDVY
jgi:hypothetical protein